MEKDKKIEQFNQLKPYTKYQCVDKNTDEKVRFMKENDTTAFVFLKGRRSRGWRYNIEDFFKCYDMIIPTDEDVEKKWHKKIKSVINALEKSGLWSDIKEKYKNLYKMTYSDKILINDLYWSMPFCCPDTPDEEIFQYNEKMSVFIDKYPFLFSSKNNRGLICINTFYIWEMSEVKTKSMYFGWQNKLFKEQIQNALTNKEKITKQARVNYDVTFEYDPDKNKAWYSEEYRGCGNGHYYIALNSSMALFCEND